MFSQIKKAFFLSENSDFSFAERENALARIYCLLFFILTPLFTLFTYEWQTGFDFICLSLITLFFLFCFLFSNSSFNVKIVVSNLPAITLFVYLFLTGYAIYAAYIRNFSVDSSFGLAILFFVFAIILKDVKHIIIYFSVTAMLGGIALFLSESTQINISFLVSFFFVFFGIGFFSVRSKAQILDRLEQRENFLKTLFNQAFDAILLVDFYSRNVVDCNLAAVQLFEVLDKNEIVGHIRDQFEEHRMTEKELVQCRRELAQNGIWKNETSFITRKGKQFWGDIVISPLIIGNTQYYVARITDITPQRIVKEAVRQNEERYRTIFRSNPQPIWIYDRNTLAFIDVNDEAIKKYGYSHTEFLNMTILDIRPDEEKQKLLDHLKNIGSDNDSLGNLVLMGDWKHRKKDGTMFEVEIVRTKITFNGREANLALVKDVTEIRITERALRESEERFRKLSDITNESIAIHENGKLLEVNAAFCKLFGYSEKEAIGMMALDFVCPESKELVTKNIFNNVEALYEGVLKKKDGSKFFAEIFGRAITYKNREARVTAINDISKKKAAAQLLVESEKKHRNLVENMPREYFFYSHDDKGVFLFLSPTITGILGYSPDEFMKHYTTYLTENPANKDVEKHTELAIQGVLQPPYELEIYHKNGSKRWLEVVETPVRDENGNVIAVEGLARDFTEQRNAEGRVRESEKNYRSLVEHSPDGIVIISDGQIVYCNPVALRIFGVKNQNEITSVFNIILPEFHKISEDRWQRAIGGENVPFTQIRIKQPGGTIVDVESKPALIFYDGKEALQIALHDLTTIRQLENERLRAQMAEETAQKLTKEIAERLKVEKQLIESQKYSRKLIESSLDMICASDIHGKIIEFNEAAQSTFGYSRYEIIGKNMEILYGLKKEHLEINKKLRNDSGSFSGEIVNVRKNGESFVSYLSASALRDYDGETFGFMGVSRDITKQKKAEKELLEAQRFSESIISSSLDMIIASDRNGKITVFNEAAQKTFGYSLDEIIGKEITMLYEDIHQHKATRRELMTDPGAFSGEIVNVRKNGERFLTFLSASSLKNPNGEIIGFMGVSRDISEYKKAAISLKESEEQFRSLAENAPVLIVKIGREATIQYVNQLAEKRRSEVMGTSIFKFIHPFAVKEYQEKLDIVFKSGKPVSFEVQGLLPNGLMGWYSTRLAPIIVNNVIDSVVIISSDTTERKIAAQKIIESEERYRDLFENATDLVQSVDRDGKILYVNKAWKDTLGYSAEEIQTKTIFEIIHPDHQASCLMLFRKIFRGERINEVEITYRTKGGRTVIVNGKISVKEENGKIISTRGIFRDITENKKAQDLMARSLQEKVVLLKEIHHRVKNNMQVISSILNLQTAYVKDKKTLEILNESQNRIKTMAFIHESLYRAKDFSNIDLSEYVLNLTNNLIHSYQISANLIEFKADVDKGIKLTLDQAIPCGLIINELISNTFKHAFSGKKKGLVTLRLVKQEKKIKLVVSDNGKGIPSNIDYENAKSLGLQLVMALVEQLGGKIKIDRKGGTNVSIAFEEKVKKDYSNT